jgi:putative endopeptidase
MACLVRTVACLRRAAFTALFASSAALACTAAVGCSGDDDEPVAQGIDESFLDRSVSPCQDFYQFACGTWIAEHPTEQSPAIERFLEGEGRSAYLLDKILEGDRRGSQYVPHERSKALGDYYGSCMKSRAALTSDRAAITGRLAEITASTTMEALARVVVGMHVDGTDALFYLGVATDPGNPERKLATFTAAGLGLPDRRYYLDASMSVVPQYEEHMQRMKALLPTMPVIDPSAVVKVETALAAAVDADDNTGDPIAAYNVLTLGAFTATSPTFPWVDYLRGAGFPGLAEINVRRPVYLMKLDAVWANTSLEEMKSYLLWRVLEDFAETMGKDVVAEEARFHQGVFSGSSTPAPDWWACQQSTKWALGFALSRPYVAVMFDAEKMTASQNLIASLQRAFRQRLASRTWIDPATREEAAAKLDKVAEKVGFPDIWPTEPPVEDAFSFQSNLLAARRWYRRMNVERISEAVDRDGWSVPPCTTNAFYSPYRNEIVFPAAILQTPMFSTRRPSALNYGAIGAVIGHELTHGFDDDGRKFDGDGKLRSWWTEATDREFVGRSKCIADQYASYDAVPGVPVDGTLTLGENIADLGGLKLAYAAYHASGANDSFAGAFGPDQQFFLAYAQVWCANFSEEIARSRVRIDPHAPAKFRVNGVIRNMTEFAETFQCASGSPMAPQDRCEVW